MSKREMAQFSIKLLAIYTIVKGLEYSGTLAQLFQLKNEHMGDFALTSIMYGIIPLVLYLIIGSLLWFKSNWFAKFMVSDGEIKKENLKITPKKIQVIAFSVIGLYLIITNVLTIPRYVYIFILQESNSYRDLSYRYYEIGQMTVSVVLIIFGLYLFIHSQKLVKKINKFYDRRIVDKRVVNLKNFND